ncbi:MAG TPA: hypothetical protein VFI73_10010 [Candidatus Nitrosopolaris sp.]|nr:hypothetical protein [Candidatus Nitrosopolaris sp.]
MTKSLEILVIIFSIGGYGFLFQEGALALAQPMNPIVPQQQIPQQQIPQQQPSLQPQLQQGQPLYNPNQVVACLNHVLVDSMVKAGTTPNLTLHNNSKGVTPELNQTFIQNATQTLDLCIVPISK